MIGFWKFGDIKNKTAWFRGYVKFYDKSVVRFKSCSEVRQTKKQALDDARRLVV